MAASESGNQEEISKAMSVKRQHINERKKHQRRKSTAANNGVAAKHGAGIKRVAATATAQHQKNRKHGGEAASMAKQQRHGISSISGMANNMAGIIATKMASAAWHQHGVKSGSSSNRKQHRSGINGMAKAAWHISMKSSMAKKRNGVSASSGSKAWHGMWRVAY